MLFFCPWSVARAAPQNLHHDLQIILFPREKRLFGTDSLRMNPDGASKLNFNLSERIRVSEIRVNGKSAPFIFQNGLLQVPLRAVERNGVTVVTIHYTGIFDDPVPRSPVNTDDPGYGVTGIISEKGSFLQADSGWYPDTQGVSTSYRLRVEAPEGILAVSVGKCLGHETRAGRTLSTWEVEHPVEGLPLSAANYVVREKAVGRVKAATYFFPHSVHLAQGYLDATMKYMRLYENLFGPYPFDRFAVVENFFPTGYGFPSFTLLGSSVIRLPFIVDTSLGHEIAHCWWGNGVYADYENGNWSEGLTTYVADYLYKERTSRDEARDYRLQILRKFATLVSPEKDFPLRHFQSRYDPASQAIGYGKGAMLFHMLRRQLGDDLFWEALRDVFRYRLFQRTSWNDFEEAFERRCHCSLQTFFDQWLTRKGAPQLSLERIQSTRSESVWQVTGNLVQSRPTYKLQVNLTLESGRQKVTREIEVSEEETPFQITSNGPPDRLLVDPEFDTFRYLYPPEIPPSINAIKGSRGILVVIAEHAWPGVEETVRTLTLSLGLRDFKSLPEKALDAEAMEKNDLFIVGFPERSDLLSRLPQEVTIGKSGFALDGRAYSHPSAVFFGVFAHPFAAGRVMALFLPLSAEYAEEVARKVTHYGKYGYLAFSQGRIQEKGIWPVSESPLIYQWRERDVQGEKE